jgi:hypothetical protein
MHFQQRRVWARWLNKRGLPIAHIAAVLTSDALTIEHDLRITLGRPPSERDSPLLHTQHDPYERPILGPTARHVKILHELGHGRDRIAELLALCPGKVRSFLERYTPLRCGRQDPERRTRPRSKAEERAARANAKRTGDRRRRREEERARAAAWGKRDAPGELAAFLTAKSLRIEVESAQAVEDMAVVESRIATAASADPWVGPTSEKAVGTAHGKAQLVDDDVRAIRGAHAGGQSIYSLARDYKVASGTIRAIVRRETWTHL